LVAADSRQQRFDIRDGQLAGTTVVDTGCKVQIGRTAAAAVWDIAVEERDNGGGYDALKAVQEFLDAPDSIPER